MFVPFTGDRASVRRPAYVPKLKKPFFETYKVTPEKPHELVILSKSVEAVLVHPVDGRTQPCTGDSEQCWLNHRTYGLRWQGWLWVRRPVVKEICTVTITPGTVEHCPELLNPALDLRGLRLRLWRKDSRICSQLLALLNANFYAANWTPETPDMLDHLCKMWSAKPRTDRNRDCPATIAEIRARYAGDQSGR